MIEVKNLVKYYGNHAAVDDISFSLEKGKVYGFLGPNGAGKSTTMNIMTGYLAATSGEVLINGFDIVSEAEEAKKCIGYLPEIPPLYVDMTVEEYLTFVAGLKKIKKSERKAEVLSVMETTGITEYRRRLISNLSKGYRQRVGLAQAILGNPDIVILDEPTVGLDPRQIIEIRELIKKLSVDHTVILSSHIMSEISAVCDQIIIIVRGHLIANATPEELMESNREDHRIIFKVKGDMQSVRGTLQRLEGIAEMNLKVDNLNSQLVEVTLIEENADMREKVFHAMAESELPIYEMRRDEPTLEEVFLRLSDAEEQRFIMAREAMEQDKMNKRAKVAEVHATENETEKTEEGEQTE